MTPCRVYRGAPVVEALEADLVRDVAHVVVQPVKGSAKNTTRYSAEWQGVAPACPLIAETNGQRVRFSGLAGPATLTGASVEFPGGREVLARAVSDGHGGQELRRQEMIFRVELWCSSPEIRDRLASFIDVALSEVVFLDVRGWGCRVQYSGTASSDEGAVVRAWRRELLYRIEYPTVLESVLPSMLFGIGTVNGAGYVA